MDDRKLKKAPLHISIMTAIVILILCASLVVLDFSAWKSARYDIPNGWTDTAKGVRGYLLNPFSDLLPAGFTEPESDHLSDVKHLMQGLIVLAFIFIVFLVYPLKTKGFDLHEVAKRSGSIILVILLLLVLIPFDLAFRLFHYLFFPQGNWMFSPDSLLITTFPGYFFENLAMRIGICTLVAVLILFAISYLTRKK